MFVQKYKRGQTLVEIVVVVSVVLMLVSALVVGSISALRNSQKGKDRSLATKYAQEGIELSRKLRDNGWSTFLTYGDPGPKTWCLPKDNVWPASPIITSTSECDGNVDTIYNRNIKFLWNVSENRMEVTVTVSWGDISGSQQNQLTTYLTKW